MKFLDYYFINEDVIVQESKKDGYYEVQVFSPIVGKWVCYNRFELKSDAIEWAQIEENVK